VQGLEHLRKTRTKATAKAKAKAKDQSLRLRLHSGLRQSGSAFGVAFCSQG
jgi:hypothetical protein